MRLQKYLSRAGVCSRRQAEAYIQAGRVKINGAVALQLGTKVDPAVDRVKVDDKPVAVTEERVTIALNKPQGYVTSCSHPGEKTVMELIDLDRRVFPVGRLDKDSTGLLLLTDDGDLHLRLSHPSFDHEKEYEVTVARPIADGALRKMAVGMPMMGTTTRPARIERVSSRKFRIVLQEGKNRQIRRMVRKVGHHVQKLRRIRIGDIRLGRLVPGRWRYLSRRELAALKRRLDENDPP
jgi:23S rRNA pseudouridine2605 synthase/23S rRNA pseudouridine2604 synthase